MQKDRLTNKITEIEIVEETESKQFYPKKYLHKGVAGDAQEMYDALLKYSPFAISLRDMQTNCFVDVNQVFEKLFGYDHDELVGENRFVIKRERELKTEALKEEKLFSGDLSNYTETLLYTRKNGTQFWGQITRSLIEIGHCNYVMSSIIDVTQQKETELKLLKKEEEYKKLFDNSLNSISVYDIERHCFVNCNQTFTEVYGYEKCELENVSALDLAWNDIDKNNPIYKERYKENIERLKRNETIRFESEHKAKNGEKIIVDVVLFPYYIENQLYIKQVTTDVTEQILSREALKQKMDELEEVNESLKKYIESNLQLENFAHITSHDLREPIRSIVSFSQILKRNLGELSKENEEFLNYIINSGGKLKNMIQDILEFSKVNEKSFSFTSINLNDLLQRIFRDLDIVISQKESSIQMSGNLPESILAHESYLYQLFQNLIKNSLKFQRNDIKSFIKIDYKDLGTHHQFCVTDNGIGIAKEFFERIFLLFQKLHTRERYEGSGVGLAICKKIVALHKGNIWVESEINEGTQFYFTISKDME